MTDEVGMADGDEEDVQCSVCHQYCHFSVLECDCSDGRAACARHAGALCACPPHRWRLAYRYTLAELDRQLADVFGAAATVGAPVTQLHRVPALEPVAFNCSEAGLRGCSKSIVRMHAAKAVPCSL
jgi:histone demethylase JARID1